MKDKKELAKIAVAGLLLACAMPADVQAENLNAKEVYLAVAGCATCNKLSQGDTHGCGTKRGNNASGEVADADDLSTPNSANTGRPAGSMNNGAGTGAKTTPGGTAAPNQPGSNTSPYGSK